MSRDHLRPVGPGEGEEPEAVRPAHEIARRLLVEAELELRDEYTGALPSEGVQALATIALGWATLALTEPRE